MEISNPVKNEIRSFIYANLKDWQSIALDSGAEWCDQFLEITFACDDGGKIWNYQTGDNSFMGNCYSLPIWAVETIDCFSSARELSASIIEQLSEQIALQNSIDLYHSQGRG